MNSVIPKEDNCIELDPEDEYHGFRMLLSNRSPIIRQQCFDLLTSSTSPKAPLSRSALDCLADSLSHLHEDTDAFYRGELISTFRRFLVRLYQCRLASSQAMAPDAAGSENIDNFLEVYFAFLTTELAPHLSYSRHALALDVLCLISEAFGSNNEIDLNIDFARVDVQRSLFRLMLDPYDDVRSVAAKILSHTAIMKHPIAMPGFQQNVDTIAPLDTARMLASATNRADHADALGRTISLLNFAKVHTVGTDGKSHAESELRELAQNLNTFTGALNNFTISTDYPLHGSILALSYIVGDRPQNCLCIDAVEFQDLLLSGCSRIWTLSRPHLCVDSPEMESENVEETPQYGPKDLLAYAWRALRDSNLLMQAMLETIDSNYSLVTTIGELCFDQLKLLRHRGAFSTVAQTFLLCCQKARNSSDNNLKQLTSNWFDKALAELEHQADKLTRRSAGLPAIFTALLDPSDSHQFSVFFERLVQIATEKPPLPHSTSSQANLRLPQVHALNCIKDIMTNSRFRSVTEPLVVLTINLAADCMNLPIWAVKNCGLMLLRASINRLDPDTGLGSAEGGYSIRSDLPNLGNPLDVAMMLLDTTPIANTKTKISSVTELSEKPFIPSSTEAEFAALDLIGRLYMTMHELAVAKKVVVQRLSHHLWHVRAQTARLLTQMTVNGEEVGFMKAMADGINDMTSDNGCHGRLLTIKSILQGMKESVDPHEYSNSVVQILTHVLSTPRILRNQSLTAVCVEILIQLLDLHTTEPVNVTELSSALMISPSTLSATERQPQALLDIASAILLLQSFPRNPLTNVEDIVSFLQRDKDLAANSITQFLQLQHGCTEARVLTIMIRILCTPTTEDTQAIFMDGIVAMASPETLYVRVDEALQLINTLRFNHGASRKLMTSQLKLYAWLCVQAWLLEDDAPKVQLKRISYGFCLHLRAAVDDEYEESTRRAAIEALLMWTNLAGINQMVENILGKLGQLDIGCVLYDLLNDDDEDIRSLSMNVTAWMCNSPIPVVGTVQILSAPASREKLRKQLSQHYGGCEDLLFECLRRLFGLKMTVSRLRLKALIRYHLESSSVKEAIDGIVAASTDLFAEEKQNLYIDEVAEIRGWARVICALPVKMPSRVKSAIVAWVIQGLGRLVDLLQNSKGNITIGYSVDLDVLLIRVITIARVVEVHDETLEKLHERCRDSNMSAVVLSAFTWSLRQSE